jgi:hypothetical protein
MLRPLFLQTHNIFMKAAHVPGRLSGVHGCDALQIAASNNVKAFTKGVEV